MSYPTFSPVNPDHEMDRSRKPRLRITEFGDGYEQVTRMGMNNNQEDISVRWTNLYLAEGTYILDFLDSRAGLPFLWQPNGEGALRCYRCEQHTEKKKRGQRYDITAKFKETAAI